MIRRVAVVLSSLFVAFSILFVSLFRASSVNYSFHLEKDVKAQTDEKLGEKDIPYVLSYPGGILPDSPLWAIKALRDKIWLISSTNPSRKADLLLLLADKRLAASKILFERGKAEIAYSSLTKAEKYLTEAARLAHENSQKGIDTTGFYSRLSLSSLKHRQVMGEMVEMAPEDARPQIIKILGYPENVYNQTKDLLISRGLTPPESPFTGQ